jgi:formate/nitrite transporter FocA (FNT family)
MKRLFSGISAGILISIGGSTFLASDNKYVGAMFFCVALICICAKSYFLFTGKVGYLFEDHSKQQFGDVLMALLGNAIGTIACGYVLGFALPNVADAALAACTAKLEQTILMAFVRGVFCGILMYLAVSIYKEKGSYISVLFCVPAFILAGFEHSIADMFYFAASGIVSLRATGFIWIVILGNALGGMLLPMLGRIGKSEDKK